MPGHVLVVDPKGVRTEAFWSYPEPAPVEMSLGRGERAPARRPRGVGAVAPHERRAARRDAERRDRLERDRRADGSPDERAREDVLDRFRGSRRGKRARRRAARRRALRHRAPRARALVRRGDGRPERARLAHGRASRRPLGTRFSRTLGARRQARDRRALGSGRRRAARRLSQAPRGFARRSPAAAGARRRGAGPEAGAGPPRPGVANARRLRSRRAPARDEREAAARASEATLPRPARGARTAASR